MTATLAAFTRASYAGRGGGWWRRILLPGLWYGVAVLCKLSALLYGGVILTVLKSVVGSMTANHLIVVGLLFMAVVIFLPKGLMGLVRPRIERLMARQAR